jgi:reductive dehalogenase
MRPYLQVADELRDGETTTHRAPIPDDLVARAHNLKAACYFLDATMVGICEVPGIAITARESSSVRDGDFAIVILFERTRDPVAAEPGGAWLDGAQAYRAAARVGEIAVVIGEYLRQLGCTGRVHTITATDVNLHALVVAAGLGEPVGDSVEAPFIGAGFGVAAVTTNLAMAVDLPLAAGSNKRAKSFGNWLGRDGTRPGYKGRPFDGRPYHLGRYPMEKVRRAAQPTTAIDTPNVPRVPKRHDMFNRAELGDLGERAQQQALHETMITKSPFGGALLPLLGHRVPMQEGVESAEQAPGYDDPRRNSETLKAALYFLGADMVGICEIPEYAWYSHELDGTPIVPYHKYAVSILIDQGYETMEGASGDDWISGAQSMRAYLRAQLVGGIVAEHLRGLGHSARTHSVADQDVLHIPLILQSGLGELSRIGELVLNPFVGPRFKSGVITTNLPLEPDRPIDFGLQDFCSNCQKCARECPCSAIPFGDKILFNGYEMWKPDVEKCARYRITNTAGSMCGRCMKTCPFNLEGVLAERPFLWAAMNWPWARPWIAKLDDWVGNGRINPVKKWWWDLDRDDDGRFVPARRVNERELEFRPAMSPEKQKLACYPADTAPRPGESDPVPLDRKAGVERYRKLPRA